MAEALTAEAEAVEAVGRRKGGRVGGEAEAGADAVDEGEGGIGTESALLLLLLLLLACAVPSR